MTRCTRPGKKERGLLVSVAVALSMLASADVTVADEWRMFGHDVSILKDAKGNDSLSVDGRPVHADRFLSLDEFAVVGGVPVVVGTSSNGGNACEGAPFVMSFPDGKSPRLDGPLETCFLVKVEVGRDAIAFSTAAQSSAPGERWRWTAAGIESLSSIPFNVDRSKDWADLRSRQVTHPAALLDYGPVTDALNELLGADREYVTPILEGVGSVEYKGDFLIGTVCQRHSCTVVEAIVVIDMRKRSIHVAWKPENGKIVVRPAIGGWPQPARSALKAWASKWK